jgi:hypothetical protein
MYRFSTPNIDTLIHLYNRSTAMKCRTSGHDDIAYEYDTNKLCTLDVAFDDVNVYNVYEFVDTDVVPESIWFLYANGKRYKYRHEIQVPYRYC